MALDPNKKKPLNIPVAGLPAGNPLAPLLRPDQSAQPTPVSAPVTAYSAGQATRAAVGNAADVAGTVGSAVTQPYANSLRRAGEFGRGLFGVPQTPPPPTFGNVVAHTDTVATPARPTAVPAPTTAGASSAPAGGGAAPLPPVVNLGASAAYGGGGTVRNSLASSVTNGVPTYDNASIDRLNARNANPATSGAQSFGGTATPLALPTAAVAPQPNLNVNLPRPVVADAYNTREANADMKKVADSIDTALFRNSFAADRGSRSARDAQAQMLGTLAALQGKRLDVASNVAGGDRDTAAKYDLTGVDQQGQNQRALLQDTGDTNREGMRDATSVQTARIASLADLNKPTQVTDANGNVFSVSAGKATPVTGPDGKQITAAGIKADRPDANTVVSQYTEQLKALQEAASTTGKPIDTSKLDASPLGLAYQQVLSGNAAANGAPSGPPPAAIALLKSDPSKAAAFDQKYGKGASARYIK